MFLLPFPVGSLIHLESFLDKRKLMSRIVGWREGEFVLIEHPVIDGELALLPKDAALVCRGIVGGRMVSFKCSVLHNILQPFPYLFLGYPFEIDESSRREGAEVNIELPARVVLCQRDFPAPPEGGKAVDATIRNIGASECAISLPKSVDTAAASCLFISMDLPNGTQVKNLKGRFREETHMGGEGVHEVEFVDDDPNLDALFDFILLASKILSQGESEK